MNSLRLSIVLSIVVLMGAGLWSGYNVLVFASKPAQSSSTKTIYFEVGKGITRDRIAHTLETQGIITSARQFVWLGRLTQNWAKIKAGEYELSPKMRPLEVFHILTSGISVSFPVTVVEGDNIYQIAEKLEAKKLASKTSFLGLCKSAAFISTLDLGNPAPPTLEGYLLPDTYNFPRKVTSEEVIRKMLSAFKSHWTPELATDAKKLGLSRHQVLTLASIVEKETGAPEERPKIASVFHNRLKKRMPLQSDPTIIYGVWERYHGNITRAFLQEVNSYNTYKIPALPIGPISNPGREAIFATIHPDTTEFLFFVSHNDGTHEFTTNLKDHNAAVARFQLNRSAREGKSWRDLRTHNSKRL